MTTAEFCSLAGITYRQARYWEEHQLLRPHWDRGCCLWSKDDLLKANLLLAVEEAGKLSLRRTKPGECLCHLKGGCIVIDVESMRKSAKG